MIAYALLVAGYIHSEHLWKIFTGIQSSCGSHAVDVILHKDGSLEDDLLACY